MGFVAAGAAWLVYRSWQIAPNWKTRGSFAGLGIALLIGSALGGYHFTASGPVSWIHYTPQKFQNALSQGKVVVLVFTAEWCLNCKALEQSVLKDRSVAAVLNEADVAAIKVDITGRNPDGKARLQATGHLTIPLLVIYDGKGREVFKSDFYTPEQIIDSVNRARRPS
jgi:thiol:disulfide interchange protein